MDLKVYQIFYNAELHRPHLDPCFIPYDNSNGRSPFFENEVMRMLINSYQHMNCSYFGVLSWVFAQKFKMGNASSFLGIQEQMAVYPDYDVYTFFKTYPNHRIFDHPSNGHRGMVRVAQMVIDRMGIRVVLKHFIPTQMVYMNYFIARPSVYEAYVSDFLVPAMSIMSDTSDKELQSVIWQDSNYRKDTLTLTERNRLFAMYGRPYYPWHAFVCERLFSLWFSMNNSKYYLKHIA